MGVPVKINQTGIAEIQKIELDKSEQNALEISAQTIRNNIQSI